MIGRRTWAGAVALAVGLALAGCGDGTPTGSEAGGAKRATPVPKGSPGPTPPARGPTAPRVTPRPLPGEVDLAALPGTAKAAWEALGAHLGWEVRFDGRDGPVKLTGTAAPVDALLALSEAGIGYRIDTDSDDLRVGHGALPWRLARTQDGLVVGAGHVERIGGYLTFDLELWRPAYCEARYANPEPTVKLTLDGQPMKDVEVIHWGYPHWRWHVRAPIADGDKHDTLTIAVGGTFAVGLDRRALTLGLPARPPVAVDGLTLTRIALVRRGDWQLDLQGKNDGPVVGMTPLDAAGKPVETMGGHGGSMGQTFSMAKQTRARPAGMELVYYVRRESRTIDVTWADQPLSALRIPPNPGLRGRIRLGARPDRQVKVYIHCRPRQRRGNSNVTGVGSAWNPHEAHEDRRTSRLAWSGPMAVELIRGELRYRCEALTEGDYECWLRVGPYLWVRPLRFTGRDQRVDLDLALDPATGVVARVLDAGGRALRNAKLKLTLLGADGSLPEGFNRPEVDGKTDGAGTLTLTGMAPGRYLVNRKQTWTDLEASGAVVEVVEGQQARAAITLAK